MELRFNECSCWHYQFRGWIKHDCFCGGTQPVRTFDEPDYGVSVEDVDHQYSSWVISGHLYNTASISSSLLSAIPLSRPYRSPKGRCWGAGSGDRQRILASRTRSWASRLLKWDRIRSVSFILL